MKPQKTQTLSTQLPARPLWVVFYAALAGQALAATISAVAAVFTTGANDPGMYALGLFLSPLYLSLPFLAVVGAIAGITLARRRAKNTERIALIGTSVLMLVFAAYLMGFFG
jgi:hypothetical protein